MGFRVFSEHKIRCKRQFDLVFKTGKRLYGRYFLAYYRSNALSHPRMGIITAKRNVRLAVARNRVRRVIREYFRLNQASLPAVDLVFIAKKGSHAVDSKELRQCLAAMIKRLSILDKES